MAKCLARKRFEIICSDETKLEDAVSLKWILEEAEKIKEQVIGFRRHFHMYPELSGREFKTAEFIADKLREFGVDEVYENFAESTAVVGVIKGKKDGKSCVALRADMDALPIKEETGKPYSSKVEGLMHACGHDAHMAMLLGAAKILAESRDFKGYVKLIFQPCEERHDCKGAKHLVEHGVLKNPDVSAIFAFHVYPEIKTGFIGTREGAILASSDVFKLRMIGKGTHASKPHLGVDPILMASQVVSVLHHIVSRKVDPLDPAVLTIGKIKGGDAENVIPDSVEMEGTIRTLNHKVRQNFESWLNDAASGIARAYGGSYELKFTKGTPPLINDKRTTKFAIKTISELLGEGRAFLLEKPSMGGEDFSEYVNVVPGTFLRLGTANDKKGTTYPLHNPKFDIDEDALSVGVACEVALAVNFLNSSEE